MANEVYKKYNSINEFVGALDKYGEPDTWLSSGDTSDPYWYGTKTYQEAKERVLRGDDELAKQLRGSEKLDISIPTTGTRKKMVTGVVGFMPHVPNYLAGVPNNMIFVREQKIAKKVINVYYGCNTLSDVDADEIAAVSARVMSCVMSMERKGYRINLYAVNCAHKDGKRAGFSVKVKDSGQHIDILKMAFPFLGASWNRRFAFRFRELFAPWNTRGGEMGGSVYGDELREYLDRQRVDYDVAMSFYDARRIRTVEELEKLFINASKNLKK